MIRLRRPPVFHIQEDRFVPDTSLEKVDVAWTKLMQNNAAYHDGEILHVYSVNRTGCAGATVQVAPTSYRFHAVGNLGVHPLGVRGICKQEDLYLCGLRATTVGMYPNMWEFAPAGMVEPSQTPEAVIGKELKEETGLDLVTQPIAIAMFFDAEAQTWELVYELSVEGELHVTNEEYEQLSWFDIKSMPQGMSPPSYQMKSLL